MSAIKFRAKSDGLQLLRAIDATQAHGQEGVRADPARAAHEARLDVGDVGSERYHRALGYLRGEGTLVGDEHTATRAGAGQHHGYAAYFFTRRAVKLLGGSEGRGVGPSYLKGLPSPSGIVPRDGPAVL